MSIFLGVLFFVVIVITMNAVTADMNGLSDRMKSANINVLWIPVVTCIGVGVYFLVIKEIFWGIFLIACSLGWVKYINVLKKEHNLK